jgi:23S rRNA (uridine2552-2'-O)-methyltransferase
VGRSGKVVGIDREHTEDLGAAQVVVIIGDVADPAAKESVRGALGAPADVLLSDMAPKLSGVKITDRERHLALVVLACEWARDLLAPGGRAVIKVFSEMEAESVRLLRAQFANVVLYRPPSTRKGSSETYVIARGLKPKGCAP